METALIFYLCGISFALGGGIVLVVGAHRSQNSVASADTLAVFPLDLHTIFNLLGRISIPLANDDKSQDGIDVLSQYMRACHTLFKTPAQSEPAALVRAVRAYQGVLCWLHGHPQDDISDLAWRNAPNRLRPGASLSIFLAIQGVLKDLPTSPPPQIDISASRRARLVPWPGLAIVVIAIELQAQDHELNFTGWQQTSPGHIVRRLAI